MNVETALRFHAEQIVGEACSVTADDSLAGPLRNVEATAFSRACEDLDEALLELDALSGLLHLNEPEADRVTAHSLRFEVSEIRLAAERMEKAIAGLTDADLEALKA